MNIEDILEKVDKYKADKILKTAYDALYDLYVNPNFNPGYCEVKINDAVTCIVAVDLTSSILGTAKFQNYTAHFVSLHTGVYCTVFYGLKHIYSDSSDENIDEALHT